MRAVVTGGAGFIGSHLQPMLVAEGYDVTVLDDLSAGRRDHVAPGVEFVRGCVTDAEVVRATLAGADVVLHQAAHRAVPRSVADPLGTDRVNIAGSLTVLLAARDAGVRRVVLASSSSVYGGTDGPAGEDSPAAPRSPYAVAKLAMEHYARCFTDLYGLETVCLRYFNVYGPRQRPDSRYACVVPRFAGALLARRAPCIHGDGKQSRDFTYVDDVVAANRLALHGGVAGRAYNVASGQAATVLELFDTLAELLDVDIAPRFVADRPGDVRTSHADVSAAAAELGFRARTPLPAGLTATVAWLRGDTTSTPA